MEEMIKTLKELIDTFEFINSEISTKIVSPTALKDKKETLSILQALETKITLLIDTMREFKGNKEDARINFELLSFLIREYGNLLYTEFGELLTQAILNYNTTFTHIDKTTH